MCGGLAHIEMEWIHVIIFSWWTDTHSFKKIYICARIKYSKCVNFFHCIVSIGKSQSSRVPFKIGNWDRGCF